VGVGRADLDGFALAWVRGDDLPDGFGWLTAPEREVLSGLRLDKRRADWLLGRWAAKLAIARLPGGDRPGASILASEDGSPRVHFATAGDDVGESAGMAVDSSDSRAVSLSLSHAGGSGFAAARSGTTPIGCDIEVVEPRSAEFVADYFTAAERAAVGAERGPARDVLVNLVWSAKESALKALGEGLRLDTRSVEVDTNALTQGRPEWAPLAVTGPSGRIFRGWWRVHSGLVWTLVL